jgi:hypothetical protein
MKKYVWSATAVQGGKPFTGRLAADLMRVIIYVKSVHYASQKAYYKLAPRGDSPNPPSIK